MGIAIKMTEAYFDSKDLHYRESADGDQLELHFGGIDNIGNITIRVFFSEDDTDVSIKAWDICKFPENKKAAVFKACSEVNKQFRWVKFYVDKRDMTVTAEDDAVIQPANCGDEIFELVIRLAGIVRDAYPTFMRAIYA